MFTEPIKSISTKAASLYPGPDVCGRISHTKRIYGGTKAGLKEFPWLALLRYQGKGKRNKFAVRIR